MLRLVAVDRLRAEGFAPANIIASVPVGSRVKFALSRDGEAPPFDGAIEGTLKFISPEIDPVTGQVRIWAEIDNSAGKLRPGLQGQLLLPKN